MSAPMYGPRDRMSREQFREFDATVRQWTHNVPAECDKQELLICTFGFTHEEARRWLGVSWEKWLRILDHSDSDLDLSDTLALDFYQKGHISELECMSRLYQPYHVAAGLCRRVRNGGPNELR